MIYPYFPILKTISLIFAAPSQGFPRIAAIFVILSFFIVTNKIVQNAVFAHIF